LCSRVVVHVKCSVSCIHNFVANFFSLFHVAKLSDFVLLNYLATTSLNLATVFSLKVSKWRHGIFFDFEPCRPNYTSKKIMHQWESYCLQWLLGPGWSVWWLTIASLPCSNDYSSTFVQVISMARPLCAPAIKAKHQFLLSFERFASQQKTVFSWGVDK